MKVDLQPLAPGNNSLAYLEKRILDDNYRGDVSSQHNRWTFEDLIYVLKELQAHKGSKNLLQIRTTDKAKRPRNVADEFDYAEFCEKVKKHLNKGSQDSMRKNWFVDWHRAGWLQRFDKNGDEIMPYSKSSVKFVKISPEGMKFLSTSSTLDKYYVFSKGLDSLYSGTLEVVLDLLRNYSLDYVDLHEFTFFVTGISTPGSFSLSRSEAVELIREWRNITSLNRRMIDVHLSKQLVKSPKIKTKIKQRDYHNWINKTQQTFSLLQQSVYFELRNNSNFSHFDRLYLTGSNVEPGSEYSGKPKAKLSRNSQQKSEYFAKHGIKKHKGFELHHIVALTWAESDHEFKLFDNWQNLIYIDAFTHAKVSQSGNKHVRLVISGDGLALEAHDGERIELIEGENLIYSRALKNKMLTYNSRLNDSKVDKLIPKLKSDTGKAFSV